MIGRHGAGQRIGTVDVHGAGATHALAAGAAKGQRRVDVVLDPDQRVENHRPAVAGIDVISIDLRVTAVVGTPAINPEFAFRFGFRRMRPALAYADLGIFGQRKLDHWLFPSVPGAVQREAVRRITGTVTNSDSREGPGPAAQ